MDEMNAVGFAALFASGVGAGVLNSMAGGGGMFVLPALMLLGLPANVANGTYRLSVITQSSSGVLLFHRAGKLHTGAIGPIVAPTIVGSLLGARAASVTPSELLKPILLGTMIAMALILAFRPGTVPAADEQPVPVGKSPKAILGLFAAGFYGGFIQAGVGFVLLTVLAGILRYDLVRANALKLVCTLVFTVPALIVFVAAGQVAWIPATIVAVATVLGSQLGVRLAITADPKIVRRIVLGGVIATCVAALLKD